MTLNEKFNPYMETIRTSFFPKIRILFTQDKGDLFPLVVSLLWSGDNNKKFNARVLFVSTAKMDNNYSSSKLSSFALVTVCSEFLLNPF